MKPEYAKVLTEYSLEKEVRVIEETLELGRVVGGFRLKNWTTTKVINLVMFDLIFSLLCAGHGAFFLLMGAFGIVGLWSLDPIIIISGIFYSIVSIYYIKKSILLKDRVRLYPYRKKYYKHYDYFIVINSQKIDEIYTDESHRLIVKEWLLRSKCHAIMFIEREQADNLAIRDMSILPARAKKLFKRME